MSSRARNERGDLLLEVKTSQENSTIPKQLPRLTIIFHFLLAQKTKQKKASYVKVFFGSAFLSLQSSEAE
jgi:hypothetical protein